MSDVSVDAALLAAIQARLDEAKRLLEEVEDHWGEEDMVYRFYHRSFKVYRLQDLTGKLVEFFLEIGQAIEPRLHLNKTFMAIVYEGIEKKFHIVHNERWLYETRPILEAFFHAKHMLRMMIRYGEALEEPPSRLPSGWATVLYLFNSR